MAEFAVEVHPLAADEAESAEPAAAQSRSGWI
jgi:hypothetical protein